MAQVLDATGSNTSNSLTWNHTVTSSGTNRGLYVGVMSWNNGGPTRTVSGVTYNSVSMGAVSSSSQNAPADFANVSWLYLPNPATGTNQVAITLTGSATIVVAASYSFTGVDQTTGIDVNTINSGTAGTASNSLTLGAANEYMLDIFAHASANTPSSQTGTSVVSTAAGGFLGASQYKLQTSSGSQSLSYTMPDPGDGWALSTIAVLSAAGVVVPPTGYVQGNAPQPHISTRVMMF